MFISTLLAIVINVAKAEVGLTIYQLFRSDNYLRKIVTGIFKHNFATLDTGNIHSQGLIGHLRQGDGSVAASYSQPSTSVVPMHFPSPLVAITKGMGMPLLSIT